MEIKRTIPKGAAGSKDFKTRKIFVGGIPSTVSEGDTIPFLPLMCMTLKLEAVLPTRS